MAVVGKVGGAGVVAASALVLTASCLLAFPSLRRRLKRDRTELDLRSMSLASELDEVSARAKQEQLENEQAMRLSNRTAAELRTSVKALTGEADSLRLQVARMQEEIKAGQRANESARSDLHAAEKANIELRGDQEDEAHQLRTQIRELEAKCVKVKAEWDRDHQALSESVATGRNQAEVRRATCAPICCVPRPAAPCPVLLLHAPSCCSMPRPASPCCVLRASRCARQFALS